MNRLPSYNVVLHQTVVLQQVWSLSHFPMHGLG
jgi:hypothetical protein